MKFSLHPDESSARTGIALESGPYDGVVPVDQVFVENRIRFLNPDRLAIACALMARDYVAAQIEFPKPCSLEVANGLEQVFAPLSVRVETIDYNPFAKPGGERTARLRLPEADQTDQPAPTGGDPAVHLDFGLADSQSHSSFIGLSEMYLASNLRLLASDSPVSLGLGILGLCILFAEDFSIARIVLPGRLARQIPNPDALRHTTLCTNIELVSEGF